jgi:asparagine synthase (glutamine-hydrolysing)
MTPLELVSGMVRGIDPTATPLPAAPPGLTTRMALEEVVRRALQRPPCVVSFSGGRDSSAVLAVAAHVARRDDLPLPIPVTVRLPGSPDAQEDSWQELVLRHLDIEDWVRLPFDDELDALGPYAQAVLKRHGLLWPPNAHFHLPIAAQAPGGTVITGFGGDELLTPDPLCLRVNQVVGRQVRIQRRDVLRLAAFFGPKPVRRAGMRHRLRDVPPRPWLRSEAQRAITADEVNCLLAEPLRWDAMIDRSWWRARYLRVGNRSLDQVASVHDTAVCSPFTDALVLAAIVNEGGRTGFPNRTAAMQHLVGDLLPEQLVSRFSKAEFTRAFWHRHAAAFAADWNGSGVDSDLVDVAKLRQKWLGMEGPHDFRTLALLQSAWLSACNSWRVNGRRSGGPS